MTIELETVCRKCGTTFTPEHRDFVTGAWRTVPKAGVEVRILAGRVSAMTIDLFALKPNDARALTEVIDLLARHCSVAEVESFLADLERWHRLQGPKTRHRDRADARRELEQWQRFLDSLEGTS